MERVYRTLLENALEQVKDQDLDKVLIDWYNNPGKYGIIRVSEGSLRSGNYNVRGKPFFANDHFRAITEQPEPQRTDEILYEFVRTDSDLVTSIWVEKPIKEKGDEE
jgi:hypothetical protein